MGILPASTLGRFTSVAAHRSLPRSLHLDRCTSVAHLNKTVRVVRRSLSFKIDPASAGFCRFLGLLPFCQRWVRGRLSCFIFGTLRRDWFVWLLPVWTLRRVGWRASCLLRLSVAAPRSLHLNKTVRVARRSLSFKIDPASAGFCRFLGLLPFCQRWVRGRLSCFIFGTLRRDWFVWLLPVWTLRRVGWRAACPLRLSVAARNPKNNRLSFGIRQDRDPAVR